MSAHSIVPVRRSSRVLVTLPLAVSGQKKDGSHISGAAETILVNKHGAKIRSSIPLEPQMQLRVALLAPYKWRTAEVVWANFDAHEYGIQLQNPENFWGVCFPPEDWELLDPAGPAPDMPQIAIMPSLSDQSPDAPDHDRPLEPLLIPERGT